MPPSPQQDYPDHVGERLLAVSQLGRHVLMTAGLFGALWAATSIDHIQRPSAGPATLSASAPAADQDRTGAIPTSMQDRAKAAHAGSDEGANHPCIGVGDPASAAAASALWQPAPPSAAARHPWASADDLCFEAEPGLSSQARPDGGARRMAGLFSRERPCT